MDTGITVVIPTFNRPDALVRTIELVKDCDPPPCEIIVHVDAGDNLSVDAVRSAFRDVLILESLETLGPGGSRNRLVSAASNEIVVSLDDDSFPIDNDFFAMGKKSVADHPEAAVIAMNIIHDDEAMIERSGDSYEVAEFVGCGCIYRKSAFLETAGYVPVQPAYGVEEADLALQLLDRNWTIVHDNNLRVRHATTRSHQAGAVVTSAHISNVALLCFLRYPEGYWGFGLAQVANRVIWSLRNRRYFGVVSGILAIPVKIWRFRKFRRPVRSATLRKARSLRSPSVATSGNGE